MLELEKLLVAAIKESTNNFVGISDVSKDVLFLILQEKTLFEDLPEKLYVEVYPLDGFHRPMAGNTRVNRSGNYYKHKAVLLHDGIEAAAFGAHNYIYKTKGFRAYMFESGEIRILTPYCTIDDEGFSLMNEIWDGIGDFSIYHLNHIQPLKELFGTIQRNDDQVSDDPFISAGLIKIIANIKKPFKKDYCLEYLLTPPDVDLLSDFSLDVRESLWDICLSDAFEAHNGLNWQNRAMAILIDSGISPAPSQIVSYMKNLRRNSNLDTAQIFDRLDMLERNLNGSITKLTDEIKSPEFWLDCFENSSLASSAIRAFKRSPSVETVKTLSLEILEFFKYQIENQGLWKELWLDNKPKHEKTVQNIFFSLASSFCKAYDLDITPEANSGNGPVDFKISTGHNSKVVIEFKLSTNPGVIHGYETQLEIYKHADNTDHGIFVLVDVGEIGNTLNKLDSIKARAVARGDSASEIIYINALQKLSASKRK